MNRAQRRKAQKVKNFSDKKISEKIFSEKFREKYSTPEPEQPDFSDVPLATMCQSIQLLINELYKRGYPVYDFDNKDKYVQGIQIIKDKVYFLAAKEDDAIEKV